MVRPLCRQAGLGKWSVAGQDSASLATACMCMHSGAINQLSLFAEFAWLPSIPAFHVPTLDTAPALAPPFQSPSIPFDPGPRYLILGLLQLLAAVVGLIAPYWVSELQPASAVQLPRPLDSCQGPVAASWHGMAGRAQHTACSLTFQWGHPVHHG